MARVIRALLLLLASLFVAAADPMPVEEFKEKAVPLVRRFIFLKYERFRASELTFRHLKQVRAPPQAFFCVARRCIHQLPRCCVPYPRSTWPTSSA